MRIAGILLLLFVAALPLIAQTTEITYQGKLTDGANPANGSYDMQFQLYAVVSGSQTAVGTPVERLGVPVTNGVFTVALDFGNLSTSFTGADRYIGIAVRPAGGSSYTALSPTQKITSAPYALRSRISQHASTADLADSAVTAEAAMTATTAATANNALQLGGVAANQYVVTTDPRMTNARNPLPGSVEYIHNAGAQAQPNASVWVTGGGNFGGAGIFGGTLSAGGVVSGSRINTLTSFSINGNRFLSNPGTNNTFGGTDTGLLNTGADNTFFGYVAGDANTTGSDNSFFGSDAGGSNTGGNHNSFFGSDSGDQNSSGQDNAFFGSNSGGANTAGSSNTFVGRSSGAANTTGGNNTLIGSGANVSTGDLTYATAVGSGAVVSENQTIQLGRSDGSDRVRTPGRIIAESGMQVGESGANSSMFVYGFVSITQNLNVGGMITKGGGSFKIDHPLDPKNKFLYHSFIESPDMMNIYNGNVTTGDDGEATVTLPDYFEALNRDFRYQLTVIGVFAQAIVSQEITGNTFKIRSDKPGVKVSWQVTGVRKDPYAERNRIQTEVDKPEDERGKYLYPEAYERIEDSNRPEQP